MKKIVEWLRESNRWKHLCGGVLIGAGSDDLYCAIYAGTGVAGALELKDLLWGGRWDWLDLSVTLLGALIGFGLRTLVV